MSELHERVVPFTAGDGLPLTLINVRGERAPDKGPVILVHGAGVRANLFRAPIPTTLVDYLIAHGYDPWLLNWRASIDIPPNPWTLDQAAVHDHPQAIRTVAEQTGHDTVKAVIHCQGSTSFMMSAVAGLVPQVTTIVSNAVSLHPVVPAWSRFKIKYMVPMLKALTDYIDPRWDFSTPNAAAKLLNLMMRLGHHECHNSVCKQVSITYGSGFPALWRHENINEETHEWLRKEFAHVPMTFFSQIARCVDRGHLVSMGEHRELPVDFTAAPPRTDARVAFFAGQFNQCFLAESQVKSFEFFDRHRKNRHSLHVLPTYSHLDVFWGVNAVRDTYPLILAELDKPT